MKKIYLFLIAIVFTINFSYAQWTTGSGNINNTNTGNVGIGTTNPFYPLQVGANIWNNLGSNYMLAVAGDMVIGNASPGSQPELTIHEGTTGSFAQIKKYNGYTVFSDSQGIINLNSNIGIGTTSPLTQVHIQGTGSAGSNLSILTLTNNIAGAAGNTASIDFNPTSDPSSVYGRLGSIMEGSSKAGLYFSTYNPSSGFGERLRIDGSGNVGIGTRAPDSKLTVNGTIHSKEVKVNMDFLPDYVFNLAYELVPLAKVKAYIDEHHHLPEVPSARQTAKEGLNLGEMNAILLKKVEELTLYMIDKDKQVNNLQNEVNQLKQQQRSYQSQQEEISQLKEQMATITKALTKN